MVIYTPDFWTALKVILLEGITAAKSNLNSSVHTLGRKEQSVNLAKSIALQP